MSERPSILLVEDTPHAAQFTFEALSRYGYDVHTVEAGEPALTWAQEHDGSIALAILDMVLPGMGGLELAWRLRKLRPDLPVILISGHTEETFLVQSFSNAHTSFLAKPFSMQGLLLAVGSALEDSTQKA